MIVEDNELLSRNIRDYLKLEKIDSVQIFAGNEALYALSEWHFDAIIMDLWLWKYDGIDLIDNIRRQGKNVPILILTARDTMKDKKKGFESWADDYLTKPFDYEELVMRLEALVRRNFVNKSNLIEIGNLVIDKEKREVVQNAEVMALSKHEFDLLLYLAQYRGKMISKKELLETIWGEYDDFSPSRTVDIYVGYVRKKLGKDVIQTVRGSWYMIG